MALPAEAVSFSLESLAEAYEVQALVAGKVGAVAAWKTGAPSPEAEPIMAPIFEGLVHGSPALLEAARFHRLGIEAEIAYRLGCDLPVRERPYTRDEIVAAVAAILPAIEVVDSRLAGGEDLDPLWKLADNQINGGLVVGRVIDDWRRIDPMTLPVVLTVDGEVAASGEGGNTAGDPLRLLVWMANNVGDHCDGLRAGQIVTTGSLTGLRFVEPGAHVAAEFAGLGRVEVTFQA
ncbi:MAG TPA: fumarylacetoacetate hydrolase family protein [Geminicoccaceae bacterium]|nr:fumarylacetoacetate hydrolase family protein [Geminicoccaceae bacterium]